jgi:hypothetical protein
MLVQLPPIHLGEEEGHPKWYKMVEHMDRWNGTSEVTDQVTEESTAWPVGSGEGHTQGQSD